jgi:hypothetical protein
VLHPPSFRKLLLLPGCFLFAVLLAMPPRAYTRDEPPAAARTEAMDSLRAAYQQALRALSSPELEARKHRRRFLQQQGYAEVLHELLAGDALSALLSWLRSSLQLEYSLPQRPLYLYVRPPASRRDTSLAGRMLPSSGGPVPILLQEDRAFPADPWPAEPASLRR